MSKIIHVSGVKGVGKTVITQELHNQTTPDGHEIFTIHVSELLYELTRKIHGKEWGEIGSADKVGMRMSVIDYVGLIDKPVVLLDSHLIDMKGDEPRLIMPPEFEPIIDGYIVMTADHDRIVTQRFGDLDFRERDLDPNRIRLEDAAEQRFAMELASRKGQLPLIIQNGWKPDTKRDILQGVDLFMRGRMGIEGGWDRRL